MSKNKTNSKFKIWHALIVIIGLAFIIVAFTIENSAPYLTLLVVIIAWVKLILDELHKEQTKDLMRGEDYLPVIRVFEQPSFSPNDISCTFRLVNEGKGIAKVVYVYLDCIEGKIKKLVNLNTKDYLMKRWANDPGKLKFIHEYEIHFSLRNTDLHTKLMPNAKFTIEYVDNFDNGYKYIYPIKQKKYRRIGFYPSIDIAAGKEVKYNGDLSKKYSSQQ